MAKEEFLNFLGRARRKKNVYFTKEEKDKYENWLDEMISEEPLFNMQELLTILRFIYRSIIYLTEISAREILKREQYTGCMENLIFLINYLLHYQYQQELLKKYLIRFIKLTSDLTGYSPAEKRKIEQYYTENEIREKIHFYMAYYYD